MSRPGRAMEEPRRRRNGFLTWFFAVIGIVVALAMIPLIVLFMLLQRHFVNGIVGGSLKG